MFDQNLVERTLARLMRLDPVSSIRLSEGHDADDVAAEFLFDFSAAIGDSDHSKELDDYERQRFGMDELPAGDYGELFKQFVAMMSAVVRPSEVARIAMGRPQVRRTLQPLQVKEGAA